MTQIPQEGTNMGAILTSKNANLATYFLLPSRSADSQQGATATAVLT